MSRQPKREQESSSSTTTSSTINYSSMSSLLNSSSSSSSSDEPLVVSRGKRKYEEKSEEGKEEKNNKKKKADEKLDLDLHAKLMSQASAKIESLEQKFEFNRLLQQADHNLLGYLMSPASENSLYHSLLESKSSHLETTSLVLMRMDSDESFTLNTAVSNGKTPLTFLLDLTQKSTAGEKLSRNFLQFPSILLSLPFEKLSEVANQFNEGTTAFLTAVKLNHDLATQFLLKNPLSLLETRVESGADAGLSAMELALKYQRDHMLFHMRAALTATQQQELFQKTIEVGPNKGSTIEKLLEAANNNKTLDLTAGIPPIMENIGSFIEAIKNPLQAHNTAIFNSLKLSQTDHFKCFNTLHDFETPFTAAVKHNTEIAKAMYLALSESQREQIALEKTQSGINNFQLAIKNKKISLVLYMLLGLPLDARRKLMFSSLPKGTEFEWRENTFLYAVSYFINHLGVNNYLAIYSLLLAFPQPERNEIFSNVLMKESSTGYDPMLHAMAPQGYCTQFISFLSYASFSENNSLHKVLVGPLIKTNPSKSILYALWSEVEEIQKKPDLQEILFTKGIFKLFIQHCLPVFLRNQKINYAYFIRLIHSYAPEYWTKNPIADPRKKQQLAEIILTPNEDGLTLVGMAIKYNQFNVLELLLNRFFTKVDIDKEKYLNHNFKNFLTLVITFDHIESFSCLGKHVPSAIFRKALLEDIVVNNISCSALMHAAILNNNKMMDDIIRFSKERLNMDLKDIKSMIPQKCPQSLPGGVYLQAKKELEERIALYPTSKWFINTSMFKSISSSSISIQTTSISASAIAEEFAPPKPSHSS